MPVTQRHFYKPGDFEEAAKALGIYDRPFDGYARVVYTRQEGAPWKFCTGQFVMGTDAGGDLAECYPTFAFISRTLHNISLQKFLSLLTSESGLEIAPTFPPLRLPVTHQNWKEEIVPSYATTSGMPARRFRIALEANSVFSNEQLVAYHLPYRTSAASYAREFLALGPQDSVDRDFVIDVPDSRGAIRMNDGHLSIFKTNTSTPLRLVGDIDGVQVDISNDGVLEMDDQNFRNVELWLVTDGNDLADYISTSQWPYKYAVAPSETEQEQKLLELIRKGESETCEFKPYIDLNNDKAAELEKTVCALSNQRGGTLFIGITDDGEIEGLAGELTRRPDELEAALADYEKQVCKRLRETLKDNQCFTSRIAAIAGTRILVVEVTPSEETNYSLQSNMAYIRHGATSARLLPADMKEKRKSTFGMPGDF